jgi:DNA-directed RNA polymerase subunit RPC12/RpoP
MENNLFKIVVTITCGNCKNDFELDLRDITSIRRNECPYCKKTTAIARIVGYLKDN